MEEIWKELYGYQFSNFGRVKNRFGRECHPYLLKNKGFQTMRMCLRVDKQRKMISIPNVVYRLFGELADGNIDRLHIRHKDGNPANNRIDNLICSKAYRQKPTAEQIARYEKEILPCIRHIIKSDGLISSQKHGMDMDNVIGNACLLCWKYLASFFGSCYAFVKKYTMIAFAMEWKQHKVYREYVRIDDLYHEDKI